MATITTDTYLTGSALNEAWTITNGATLYIDPQYFTAPVQPFGNILCTTKGTLQINNTSSTQIFTMSMASFNNDFVFEGNGEFTISGSMVEIYTGDGTANQTIDFNNIGGVTIDYPPCVWVQSGSNGPLIPFQNLGSTISGSEPFYMPLSGALGPQGQGVGSGSFGGVMGSWEGGRYFNFTSGSGIAIFGDGTYGAVIPNGFKVYYPNIHITSQPTIVSFANKTLLDFIPTGKFNFKNVNFSRNIYLSDPSTFTSGYLENVGFANLLRLAASSGPVTLKNVSVGPPTDVNPSTIFNQITNITGELVVDGLYITQATDRINSTATTTMFNFQNNPDVVQVDNIYCNFIHKLNSGTGGNAAAHTLGVFSYMNNFTAYNWTAIGAGWSLGPMNNFTIIGMKHSSTPFTPIGEPIAKWRQFALANTGLNKATFGQFRRLQGGVPPRATGLILDNPTNDSINYIDWDYDTEYLGTPYCANINGISGTNQMMANCKFGRVTNNGFFGTSTGTNTTSNIKLDNVRGPYDLRSTGVSGLTQNFMGASDSHTGVPGASNVNPYSLMYVDSNQITGSAGRICVGPFSPETSNDYFTFSNTSSIYFNNQGRIFIDSIGDYAEFTTVEPMKGITSFPSSGVLRYTTNAAINSTTISGSFSYSFEMQPYGSPFSGSLLPLTVANLSSSFAAISASGLYNSNEGLMMKTRITSTTTSVYNNALVRVDISCSVDPNYQAADSFITFAGGSSTDKYELTKYSDDSVLFTFIGVGTHYFPTTGLLGTQVYVRRYVKINGNYVSVVNSKVNPTTVTLGDNGTVNLYAGNEIQVASSDPSTIWNYTTRTLTDGTFTTADRTQLNKTLTTGKFIALK